MNVYESCPVLQSQSFTLRQVEAADAPALPPRLYSVP